VRRDTPSPSPRSINIVMLSATKAAPTITIQMSTGPGPVKASAVGALDDDAVGDAGEDEAPDVAPGAEADVAAGALVVGVVEPATLVVGVAGVVEPGVDAGSDVVGDVDVPEIWTTVNPPTLFPETWPGEVSPTKV
jgi:hypothetical protein